MNQHIMSVSDASAAIASGRVLLIAGDEKVLTHLPQGSWIGGTIPYFMTEEKGGLVTQERVFVTDLTETNVKVSIKVYDEKTLSRVYLDGPKNGFSFILIPALSKAHLTFALEAPNYEHFGAQPLIGWIAGVHLSELGRSRPKVFDGTTGLAYEEAAIVMAAELPQGKAAEVGIINLFEQGDGDTLTFDRDGFSAHDVQVNGVKRPFADYLHEKQLDTKLPLVADYYGAQINISFQGVDADSKDVNFYAPVFKGVEYKHAKPVPNYVQSFQDKLACEGRLDSSQLIFSCNCILNYLFSELEGKQTPPFAGPITFGEIAYQLLNQTLVYLTIHD